MSYKLLAITNHNMHTFVLALKGTIDATLKTDNISEMPKLEKMFRDVTLGGRYSPQNCTSRDRVAVIVPYRNRSDHLRSFLFHMHNLLPRQQIGKVSASVILSYLQFYIKLATLHSTNS